MPLSLRLPGRRRRRGGDVVSTAKPPALAPELIEPRDLWDEAYQALRLANSELVEHYEESIMRLDSSNTSLAPLGTLARQEQLATVIKKRLESIEHDRIYVKILGKTIVLQEQVDRFGRIIMFAKDFVSSAVSAEPHAALAWAGVCMLLPLLLNPTSQREEATQGLESIPFIVHRYQVIERLRQPIKATISCRQAASGTLVKDLEMKMIQLYTKILEYQIRLVHHHFHNSAVRFGRDFVKADDWKMMFSQIQSLDTQCTQIAADLGQDELETGIKQNNAKIEGMLRSWNVGLQGLREELRYTSAAIEASATEGHDRRKKDDTRDLLRALRASNPYRDQMERTPSRHPDTCLWALNHVLFHNWRNDARAKLLWISADPGCGKSVLSKCLIEEQLVAMDPQHDIICYFFFKDISPDSRSITKALSAILHQLFTRSPELVVHAESAFADNGIEMSSMFDTLWDILMDVAKDPRVGRIICILDALDECEESQRGILIEKLKRFCASLGHVDKQLRFLVTSRPYRKIRTAFHSLVRGVPTIHLSGDNETDSIKSEIDLVIRSEVELIASERLLDTETETFLLRQLLNMENRTYLWLHLILDQLRNSDNAGNKKAIQAEIQDLPQTVSSAYETLLGKTKDRGLATKLLHIVVGASRALTVQELNVALAIDHTSRNYLDLDLEREEAFELRVKSICGLFIYIDRSYVFLIHQTAKEFLVSRREDDVSLTGLWEHSLKPSISSGILAGICVNLLLFDEFEGYPSPLEDTGCPLSDQDYKTYCNDHALFDYAAHSWVDHVRESPLELQQMLVERTVTLCDVRSRRCRAWCCAMSFGNPAFKLHRDYTSLILASELGLAVLVEHLLSKAAADINAKDENGASALNRAVKSISNDVVKLLLDHGADPEGGDWDSDWHSDVDDHGSDIHVKPFSGRPLWVATTHINHDAMRMLLAAGADPNARRIEDGLPCENALHAATAFGLLGDQELSEVLLTMRILLDQGADVNARVEDPTYITSAGLHCNTKNSDMKLTKGLTSLQIAVLSNSLHGARLLLKYGADPDGEVLIDYDDVESSAVSLRSSQSAEYNHDGSVGATSAQRASPDGSAEIGSNHSPVDHSEGSVNIHHTPPVRKLAKRSEEKSHHAQTLDACFRAISKPTVLHVAILSGSEDMVSVLLQCGAFKPDEPTFPEEPTALHLAAFCDSGLTMRALLEHVSNADPFMDGDKTTPLHIAAACGNTATVDELLKHGAIIDARLHGGAADDLKVTGSPPGARLKQSLKDLVPVCTSPWDNDNYQVVHRLLAGGADIQAKDIDGNTPLHEASRKGNVDMTKGLLHHGASVYAMNDGGETPLDFAMAEGHESVIKQLEVDDTSEGRSHLHLYIPNIALLAAIGQPSMNGYLPCIWTSSLPYLTTDYQRARWGTNLPIMSRSCPRIYFTPADIEDAIYKSRSSVDLTAFGTLLDNRFILAVLSKNLASACTSRLQLRRVQPWPDARPHIGIGHPEIPDLCQQT
ncbi:hypothetical protein G7Y79_00010g028370 [Physcia stellaris]|nr:hypothetical protein G7Y79_00010g028370 [Physcia stellaris]